MAESIAGTGLVKRYGARTVVNRVCLNLERGEIVGLLGPNGAGKTTTFYMMVGLVRADEGKVVIDSEEITNKPMHKRALMGIGYLAQEASIFRRLSVRDNILMVCQAAGLHGKEQVERAESLMQEFNIAHLAGRNGSALSGGERRRVEIARSLAASPSFILLDEPFTGIDPIAIGELQELIMHLRDRGLGVLITDHNVRETLSITERAYLMHDGRILLSGTSTEISDSPVAREFYLGERFSL